MIHTVARRDLTQAFAPMRKIFGSILLTMAVLSPVCTHAAEVRDQAPVLQPSDLLPGWQGTSGEMVPEKHWSQAIRKLKPIRVFVDRANIAVVTSEDKTHQSGVYIVTVVSSYAPIDEAGRKFSWDSEANMLRFKFSRQ